MKNLYAEYGDMMIQLEILNGRIGEVKRRIAEELNVRAGSGKLGPDAEEGKGDRIPNT